MIFHLQKHFLYIYLFSSSTVWMTYYLLFSSLKCLFFLQECNWSLEYYSLDYIHVSIQTYHWKKQHQCNFTWYYHTYGRITNKLTLILLTKTGHFNLFFFFVKVSNNSKISVRSHPCGTICKERVAVQTNQYEMCMKTGSNLTKLSLNKEWNQVHAELDQVKNMKVRMHVV